MYKTKAKIENELEVISNTNDFEYLMDYSSTSNKDLKGTSPVGLLSSALSGCILMVLKGYYLRKGIKDVKIYYNSTLEDKVFNILLEINKEISVEEEFEMRKALKERCNVSNMLSKDVVINIVFRSK